MELRPDFMDLADGTWKEAPLRNATAGSHAGGGFALNASTDISGEPLDAEFRGGMKNSKTLEASLAWQTAGAGPGFGKVDLWFPEEQASLIAIEFDGKPVFEGWDDKPIRKDVGKITVRDAASGDELAVIESKDGAFPRVEIFFEPERKDRGLSIRLFNVGNPNASAIGDATELNIEIGL